MKNNPDSTGYDPTTSTYHEHHEWSGDVPLSVTIVESVTDVTGDDPMEIDPLYDTVDVDALEALLRSRNEGDDLSGGYVEFEFNDRQVTVSAAGGICVRCEPEDPVPSE